MNQENVTYRSYLLRLWRVKQNGDWGWRASLEEVGSRHHRAFNNLDTLFRYLATETAEAVSTPPDSESEETGK